MKHFFQKNKKLLSMIVTFAMIISLGSGAGAPARVRAEETEEATITITSQPKNITVMAGDISESLTVEATTTATGGALTFQWYSCDENGTNEKEEEGESAKTETFDIPTDLAAGEYYYYCEVGAEDVAPVQSRVANVTVENVMEENPIATVEETGDGSCNHEEGMVFNDLDTSDTVTISEDATYYLTDDYEFSKRPIVISSGCTVVICTNGYNISNSESYNNTYLFKVFTGAKLIIKNCSEEKESEITARFGDSVARGDVILCGGKLEVYNVTLKNVTGGTRPRVIGIDGQNAGEIYLYDSTIASLLVGISNVNDDLKCGTVTAENCKFEMTDPMDSGYWFGFRSLNKVVLKNCTVTGDIIADNVQCVVFENCELNCNDFKNSSYAAIGIKNNSCEEESVIKNCTLTAPNLTAISYVTNGSVDGLILLENSTINAKEGIKLFEAGSAKLYCTIKGKTPLTVEKAHMSFQGDVVLDMEEAELQQSEMKVALRYEDDLPQSVDSPVLLALCPSDYASYFTVDNAGGYVYSEPNEEMYNLYLGKPGFTQQPTSENPKVEVNLTKNVSYQWYSAKETETFINDTNTINGEAGIYNYAGENKWSGFEFGGEYVYFGAVGSFKAGDKLVIEWDKADAVSGQFKIAIDDYEYFPISEENSSFTYVVSSMTESLTVMFVLGEGYDAPPTVTAKIISNKIADPVEGQNSNTLKQGSKGKTYACVATWNEGSELEFSATSDFITLAKDIENSTPDNEPTAPITITTQPVNVTAKKGEKATFTVEAEAADGITLKYQWQVDCGEGFRKADGSGTDSATYTTYSLDGPENGYKYRCVITDANDSSVSVTSEEAILTVVLLPKPTQLEGVSISKTDDGYEVTGLADAGEGYRWGYNAYKFDGDNLDEVIEYKINEHLNYGPWEDEIANSLNESYVITTYTNPNIGVPESLDNYDYIEILKLNENSLICGVAVLALPKAASEPTVTPSPSEHDGHDGWSVLTKPESFNNSSAMSIDRAGKYYLNADLTKVNITINADVTICLNGHTIYGDPSYTTGTLRIAEGCSVTICDCQKAGCIKSTQRSSSSGAIYNLGKVSLFDVTLDASESTTYGIYCNNYERSGDVESYRETDVFIKNSTIKGYYGAVRVNSVSGPGNFVAENCTFTSGYARFSYMIMTSNLSLTNCTLLSPTAAVSSEGASIVLSNCEIECNYTDQSSVNGLIYVSGREADVKIEDCKITNESAAVPINLRNYMGSVELAGKIEILVNGGSAPINVFYYVSDTDRAELIADDLDEDQAPIQITGSGTPTEDTLVLVFKVEAGKDYANKFAWAGAVPEGMYGALKTEGIGLYAIATDEPPVEEPAGPTPKEYNVSDIKVGDILYKGDTILGGDISNAYVWFCRYEYEQGVQVLEEYVIRNEMGDDVADAVWAKGWEVFDIVAEDEDGYYSIQLRAEDENGIYTKLVAPEVSVEKNTEGDYELSIQEESGYTYYYMYMPLGEDRGDGNPLTYEDALEMAEWTLAEEFKKTKSLYNEKDEAPYGNVYEEAVNFGETGGIIMVLKYLDTEDRWIEAGMNVLVVGDTSGNTPEPEVHVHDWSEAWSNNANYHWHECEGTVGTCDITANADKNGYGRHVYSNSSDRSCNTCGYKRTISGGGSYTPPYVPVTTPAPTPVPTVEPTVAPTAAPQAPVAGVVKLPTMEETIVDKTGKEVTSLIQEAGTTNKLEIAGVTDRPGAVVTYTSTNTNAVEVDAAGNVTMKNPGMSEITVTVGEGENAKQETIVVVVEEPPMYENEEEEAIKNIRLGTSWEDIPLVRYQEAGQTIDINFWGVKTWMKDKYEYVWETSDSSVAVTDNTGKVTALKPGVVTMSLGLKNKETGKMLNVKSIEVVIPDANSEKITLGTSKNNTFDKLVMKKNERVDINFFGIKNWKKEDYEYRWTSTEPSTVWVDEVGKVTPVKAGSAIITLILVDKKTGIPKYVIPTTVTVE